MAEWTKGRHERAKAHRAKGLFPRDSDFDDMLAHIEALEQVVSEQRDFINGEELPAPSWHPRPTGPGLWLRESLEFQRAPDDSFEGVRMFLVDDDYETDPAFDGKCRAFGPIPCPETQEGSNESK